MFTDTHAHFEKQYYDNYDEIINNAKNNSVNRIISCGCSKHSNLESLNVSKKHENIYSTIGYHPDQADIINKDDIKDLENMLLNDKVIGIGEIGLDYHYDGYDKDKQKELFIKQLELAKKHSLPVVIHSRDAVKDTIDILKNYPTIKGVIHSYSGSYETANIYINMGYKLGINGVVTFKNSKLKDVLIKIDPSNIVLETDSPYLTPHPFRGEKNESKNIKIIAEFLSELYKIPLEKLSEITNNSIAQIFDI